MNYRDITSKRQFKDATSYSKEEFLELLADFEQSYFEKHGITYEQYIEESLMEPPKLKTLGDALFFVLFKLKNDMIWGSFGLVFGMSEATAHTNFKTFLELLEETLIKKSNAQTRI